MVVFCDNSLNRIERKQARRNYPSWGTLIEPTDIERLAGLMGCEGAMVDSVAALERLPGVADNAPQHRRACAIAQATKANNVLTGKPAMLYETLRSCRFRLKAEKLEGRWKASLWDWGG